MTSGNGLAISYTAFNKPETITRGSNQIVFVHDSEHGRIKQAGATGETLYLNVSGMMLEKLRGEKQGEPASDARFHERQKLALRSQ